jgi:hypothetical protein
MQLSIPLPQTPDGRVYRFSPNDSAHPRHFLLGGVDEAFDVSEAARARMKLEPRSNQTVCPYSGIVADDQEFTHPDDIKAARKTVEHAVLADASAELGRMLEGFNRGQARNAPLRIQATVKTTPQPRPRFSRRDLLRELVCDHCGRDYGVYAIGLFCPDCGAPNLRLHFAREVELVGVQVELAELQAKEHEELAYRLLGNAHEDVLTAFEATLKAVYLYGVAKRGSQAPPIKPIKNDFQNIDIAQKRFAEVDVDAFNCLDEPELAALRLNIQKRHIIGHNLGVVDEKFAVHANDARIGETVHLVGEDIRVFADLSQRVIDRLDTWLGDASSPTLVKRPASLTTPDGTSSTPSVADASESALDNLPVDLGASARRLARWLCEQSKEGMTRPVSEKAIIDAFPQATPDELAQAVAELELEGYVTTRPSGARLPHLRPTLDLYATFDPVAIGSEPLADAQTLAARVLAGGDSVKVAELHVQTGWPQRRFNPAVGLVIAQVDERRVSKTGDSMYPTSFFHLQAADRVSLQRFLRQ